MNLKTVRIALSICTFWSLCRAFVQGYGMTAKRVGIERLIVSTRLHMTEVDIPSDVEEPTKNGMKTEMIEARNRLLQEAKSLVENSITGVFLNLPSERAKLQTFVSELEAFAPMSFTDQDRRQCIGDWELICTSRGPSFGSSDDKDDKKSSTLLPFSFPKPPPVLDSVRKSITILQRIVSENDANTINRVDHVIEYTPLTLQQLIPEESPFKIIRDLNINPLEVSRSRLTLVHNAEVESLIPVFRTKISLKNVTGMLYLFYVQ